GNVTGVKPGQATITVTTEDGGKTAECVVTVEKAPVKVTGVELNYKERTINIGNAGTLIATVLPKDATNKNVTWTVSDESVLKVQDGVVTPKKEGTATVTVTTEDGGFTATCEVTATAKVVAVSGVKLDKTSQTIYVGDGFQLKATISPTNASNPEVTWTSSKESVAKVDKTGKVTGVAAGTATITAKTANGKTATCAVTVSKKLVSLITLNVTSKTIDIGDTFKITPTITPSDAANKAVTWSSNNTSIATVDSNGNVKGLKSGTAVITCKAKDGSNTKASCSVTVKSYEIRHIVYRNQQIALNEVLPSNVNYIMETANGWNMVYFRLVDKTTNQPVDVSTSTLANNVVISSSNKNVVGDATNYTNYERGCYVYGEGTATLTFKYKGVTLGTTTVTVSHSYEIRYNNSSLPSSITFNWENSSDWVNFKLYDRVDKKYVSPLDHSKKLGIQSSSLVAYLGYNNEYFQLKPKNYGSDTINFTYNGEVIGSVTLKIVNPRAITSIDFTNYSVSTVTGTRAVTVSVGSTRTVSANITPSNADTSTLEWTTANNDYAKVVSYSGKSCTVRGVAKGNIQLICRDKATGKSSMLGIIVQ
ncbi:MAG: Ig-like domain-containing protein, partial [Bacteroidales bacterium]|nr:Ig-like domain-containing protein [Bacteroidales bacterium]